MTLGIGSRVRKARNDAKLTQKELAKKAGTTQAVISDIENGRNKTSSSLFDIATATGVRYEWLLKGIGAIYKGQDGDNFKRLPNQPVRMVPVLNYIQAGKFCEHFDDAIVDRFEPVTGDYPENIYWLVIEGSSMAPDFNSGDLVLINPDIQPNPGDCVVAMGTGKETSTFKKWRPRGFDDTGIEYYELVPSNPDFATIDSRYIPFTVCGVAIEFKKKLR